MHIKTAGTTWLEELIGLAEAGGDGLAMAKEIYADALRRMRTNLCAPMPSVIDIDRTALPSFEAVSTWDGATFAKTVRHDPACPFYNPSLRQLLHVGYRLPPRWRLASRPRWRSNA